MLKKQEHRIKSIKSQKSLKSLKALKSRLSSTLLSADLDVPAARHLAEVLVELQGFVHLVVGHAVAAQTSLPSLVHLSEHHKLGHVRHRHQLPVQQVSEGHRLCRPRTVCQPEPENRDRRSTPVTNQSTDILLRRKTISTTFLTR